MELARCRDRGCGLNERNTKAVVQSEYEALYTGPSFLLQMRYAQLLTIMFVTLTYSSGMPVLYLAAFITFVVAYMVDKYLLLRFYKLTPGYTKRLSQAVLSVLPLAVLLHVFFGFLTVSNTRLLSSNVNESFSIGSRSQYFHVDRLG